MQANIRNQISRLCQRLGEGFSAIFRTPEALTFGAPSDPGTSEDFVRADHVHGLPDVPADSVEDFDTYVLYFDDMMYRSTSASFPYAVQGTASFGGDDDPGDGGAWGSLHIARATIGIHYIMQWNVISGTMSSQNHVANRLRRMEFRVKPMDTTSNFTNSRVFLGLLRSGSTTAIAEANLTDAVGFFYDPASYTNWQAVVAENSNQTITDTGVPPADDGAGNVYYQYFRIDYDPDAGKVYFYIDGNLVATVNDTNMPDETRKVAGCTFVIQNITSVTRKLSIDFLLYKGVRTL